MKVLLVDDHALFRSGLRYLLADLQPGIEFREAEHSAAALALTDRSFDLILLDLHMPGTHGFGALASVREAFDNASVVIVSSEEDPKLIRQMIEGGAAGFIPKTSSPQVLISALTLVLAGGVYLPPHVLRTATARATTDSLPPALTGRLLEVLQCAVQGMSNKAIARELNISEGSVKAQLSTVFRMLGVKNRTEAVFYAAKVGLRVDAAADALPR